MFKTFILAAAFLGATSGLALAGEQYVDGTGYAVSGYDVVSYFDLPQSTVGQPQQSPAEGNVAITADYNGATFAFSTEANRDRFLADPEHFVPRFDGHCAYGVSKGGKVPGNPTLWRIVDDKLYLNITKSVVGFWEEDIPGNIELATGMWPGIEGEAASTAPVPNFASEALIAN